MVINSENRRIAAFKATAGVASRSYKQVYKQDLKTREKTRGLVENSKNSKN